MKVAPGVASVGIRGGDVEAVKAFLRTKSPHDLIKLRRVVVAIGGNNLARKVGGNQQPNQSTKDTQAEIEGLVRFIASWVPEATVTTIDIIPRSSQGWFNCRARLIAKHIKQQGTRHHHCLCFRNFVIDSRVKGSEPLRPKDYFYDGSDNVHMNTIGYEAMTAITDWLLESDRTSADSLQATVRGHEIVVTMKF